MSEEKRDKKITQTRMKSGEFVRNLFVATVEPGTTREDLMKPDFWSHVSSNFRPYDRLEVRSDDGIFFAEYLVLACERTYARVKELTWHSLTSKDVAKTIDELEEYEYRYRGPHAKHGIVRVSDATVMKDGMETKEAALAWLVDYKKTIA